MSERSGEDLAGAPRELVIHHEGESHEDALRRERFEARAQRDALSARCAALALAQAETIAMLRDIEWSGDGIPHNDNVCPCCGRWKSEGHNAVCRLGAALATPSEEVPR